MLKKARVNNHIIDNELLDLPMHIVKVGIKTLRRTMAVRLINKNYIIDENESLDDAADKGVYTVYKRTHASYNLRKLNEYCKTHNKKPSEIDLAAFIIKKPR